MSSRALRQCNYSNIRLVKNCFFGYAQSWKHGTSQDEVAMNSLHDHGGINQSIDWGFACLFFIEADKRIGRLGR